MFKFDRLYGNGKVYDVEYFEVGKRQFKEFCSHQDNIILSFCRARRNDYVVVSAWSSFDNPPSYVDYEHVFRSLNRAVDFVHNMQDANLYCLQMRSDLNHGRHFEVWHIVDDDELWADWESAVESSKETILEKAERLKDEAQDNYDLYGESTQSPVDILDYLGINWDDYCRLTDDAQDAIRDFWRNLVVWDGRYSRYCWNTLFDEETTPYLIEHYGGRIWHKDGSLRMIQC